MIQAAGYHDQKAVIINPTDFATIAPLGDITYDTLQKLGINAEMVAADWGTVVQRRGSKEPLDKGGWSLFCTSFPALDYTSPLSAPGRYGRRWPAPTAPSPPARRRSRASPTSKASPRSR